MAIGVLSVRRSGDREFADSLLEGSGFEPRGGPFSGVGERDSHRIWPGPSLLQCWRSRFIFMLSGSRSRFISALLKEQIYLHTIWLLIVLYLLFISSLSPSCLLRVALRSGFLGRRQMGPRACLPVIGIRWQPPPLVGSRTYGAPEAGAPHGNRAA